MEWDDSEYEREDVQKKTFTKWINSQLIKRNHPLIKELFLDLRDGTRLLAVLEVLCGQELRREKGRLRVHHLNNVGRALKVLEDNNVKLVNISTNDIVDGNPKLTLGLVWSIILHWQVHGVLKSVSQELQQTNLEKTLLAWCRDVTKGYMGIDIHNFTTSWSDGLAFSAIIHRFRPHLLDYDALMRKDVHSRLENAFHIAYQHLGIDKLLDPEDVNTSHPDKKSVMMYVMCFFQALHNQSIPLRRLESVDLPDEANESGSFTCSGDMNAYQASLEDVLTWLLGAEEKLAAEGSVADIVDKVKEQFHLHEEFMLELTQHQEGVEEVLHEGNKLITQGKIASEEKEEIEVQMELLNTRWQDLRIKAVDRQSKLHEKLMVLQQEQLNTMNKWLSEMESKLGHLGSIGPDLEAVKNQVETQKVLQEEVERQQETVNSLSKMVVVVDEHGGQNAYAVLEKQLSTVGERWARVCRIVEDRSSLLQAVAPSWQQLEDEELCFSQWLHRKEQQLASMEKATPSDSRAILEQVKLLQTIEQDLDVHHQLFNQLTERAQNIKDHLEKGSLATIEITSKLEKLTQRWDSLVQQMENLSKKLSNVEENQVSSHESFAEDHAKVADSMVSAHEETFQGGAKKRRLDSWRVQEWHKNLDAVSLWLDRTESTMGLANYDSSDNDVSPWDTLSLDEQQVLMEDIEADVRAQSERMQKFLSQGHHVAEDLKSVGEDAGPVQKILEEVESRWREVKLIVEQQRKKLNQMLDADRLRCEKDALELILNSHKKWLEASQRSLNNRNPEECRRVAEQCRLRAKSLQVQEEKVTRLNKEVNEAKKNSPSLMSFGVEVEEFCKEWTTVFQKLEETDRILSHAVQQTPPTKFFEATHALNVWLVSVRQALISEKVEVSNIENLEEQLRKFKELQGTIEEEESNLQYVTTLSLIHI